MQEPAFEEVSDEYAATLLELDTSWFDFDEWKMLRKSAKKRQEQYISGKNKS